jgi:nucleoside-diphosphate-sugar epimerase
MNLLIIGAFGFIGTNLSTVLKKLLNYKLIAIDITEPAHHIFDEYHSWNDIENIDWNGVDTIIHLAGKAHDTKNTSSGQEYFDINVGLTQKIFQYFLKSSASKFIFFSSVKAAADTINTDQLFEEQLPDPQTPYGKSKLEAEKYILDELGKWEKRERGNGGNIEKKVYILRPCMIHGPGNKGNLNLLYKIAQKGYPWPLGAFENKRSFCSIENILFVVQQLIEKDIEPGIYQIADDEALSTNELISLMALAQGKEARIWNIPIKTIKTIAKAGDVMHLPLNSERLKKLTESYIVSNQKIKKAIGIEKMPVTSKEGFKRTFESFKKK